MIGNSYKAHKDNVIDIFESYKKRRVEFDAVMESKEGDGVDLLFMESRIQSLKSGKFTLAVAGEVKAGKSTFINALLGTELLPSDVLQATSAIVEIFKSEKSYLKVRYADGHYEEVYDVMDTLDVNEAKEKLHEICKISDKYRDIPTTIIDEYIKNTENEIKLNDEIIKKWEVESKSNLLGKEKILADYINERTKNKIPAEIEFGYPLKWSFDELRIVDSPGVNAVGGVQNISFSYFEKANAILFVHPIKPIESESFSKFVTKVITSRSRDTLFLVLTHAGLYNDSAIDKLHSEAKRIYKKFIPDDRILVVDSLLQLIVHDFNNGKDLPEIRKDESKRKLLADYRDKAEDEGRNLTDVIVEASRFEKMYKTIDMFSMKAPCLQLREILQSIKNGFSEQESEYNSKIDRLNTKKRNPQEFENEINRIHKALEEYRLLLNNTREDINKNYTGKHTEWQREIDSLKVKYPELITKAEDIELARKHFADGQEDVKKIIERFINNVAHTLKTKLESIGKVFQEEQNITIPKVDLNSIEEETKKQAFKTNPVYGKKIESVWEDWNWCRFNWTKESRTIPVLTGVEQVFDGEKHLKSFKTTCNEKFYEVINVLPDQSKTLLDTYLKLFSKAVNSVIEERQVALKNELEKKESNQEIIEDIEMLGKKKDQLPAEIQRLKELLEELS